MGLLTPIQRSYIRNSKLVPVGGFPSDQGWANQSVYEVVRVIESVPLFLEAHLDRLKNSCRIQGINADVPDTEIEDGLNRLIKDSDDAEGNIAIFRSQGSKGAEWLAYYISHAYPSQEMAARGVPVITFQAERENPQSKQLLSVRAEADRLIKEHRVYEVLLVNRQGEITEGSRSNIFFVSANRLVTAPVRQVLPGITRQCLADICRKSGIEIEERPFHVSDVPKADAAFISGTSPKVLPISRIDHIRLDPGHPLVTGLAEKYDRETADYIRLKKMGR